MRHTSRDGSCTLTERLPVQLSISEKLTACEDRCSKRAIKIWAQYLELGMRYRLNTSLGYPFWCPLDGLTSISSSYGLRFLSFFFQATYNMFLHSNHKYEVDEVGDWTYRSVCVASGVTRRLCLIPGHASRQTVMGAQDDDCMNG